MIELIALTCLLSNPNDCRDVSLYVGNLTPIQCIMESQREAAKWVATHPEWKIAKLTCGRVGRYARA